MTAREAFVRHASTVVEHVYRQGGTGHIALPDPTTGELVILRVDQRAAEEIVAWVADLFIADIRLRKERGEPLSPQEEEALKLWHQKMPHGYSWCASASGTSFLLPLNADEAPIGPWHDGEVVLAAHPSEYDLGWRVPKAERPPGFTGAIRLDGSHRRERRSHVGSLRFPKGTGLLTAWTRFDHLNVDRAVKRLSSEDRRRYLLPYGAAVHPDGREIVFNRNYQPLYSRSGSPDDHNDRLFYFDGHSEDEKRHRAEEALRRILAGEPLPPDWRAPRRP